MTILRSSQKGISHIMRYKGVRLITKLLFILFFCILLGSSFSTYAQNYDDLIDKDEAREIMLPIVEEIWENADQTKGFRVNQYGLLLPEGTYVKPAFITEGEELVPLFCENPCWLFFVDMDPKAHFAHLTRIILLDAVTEEKQIMESDWWPYIYGPDIEDKPIFHKIEERSDQETIIFAKEPVLNIVYKKTRARSILSLSNNQTETYNPCEAWAIIICAYDDLPDTFDEDTDGMYNVLTLLGIPDDHIFFLSPHTTHVGVDQPTSIANVQWAINQVATQAVETDQVLFFYSSHGGTNSLSCVPYSPGGGSISATDLDNWLDSINCWELTIIIEACHSGSLIGLYADGTYVATEDELTGDGETNRAIFTSASTDTSSYPDIDGADDPNPLDSGSETIWGYVEAFSTISADLNNDGEISFNEGWLYAWDNDVTMIRGWNTPQMVHTWLDPNNVYHICKNNPPICDVNGFYTAECQGLKTTLMLDGTSSSDPDLGDTLVYSWTTDCPGGSFDDPMNQTPILTVDTSPGCLVTCNVTLSVTDSIGFSDSCSTTVTINDTKPPDITCPPDITAEQTSADGTPVNLGNPIVSDICDADPDVMNDAPALFPLGETTVTWTATDTCGNSSTCTQTVTIIDNTPPDITCPPDITAEQTSADGTPVDLGNPTIFDICDVDPDAMNDAPAVFPLGETIVNWIATDASGNSSSCTQKVIVVDTTPPVIHNVSASPDSLWPPNHKMVFVTLACICEDICDIAPVCKIISVESNQPVNGKGDGNTTPDWEIIGDLTLDLRAERSGNLKGDRIYTITVECTDFSGNSSTATVDVIVSHDQGKKSEITNQGKSSNSDKYNSLSIFNVATQDKGIIPGTQTQGISNLPSLPVNANTNIAGRNNLVPQSNNLSISNVATQNKGIIPVAQTQGISNLPSLPVNANTNIAGSNNYDPTMVDVKSNQENKGTESRQGNSNNPFKYNTFSVFNPVIQGFSNFAPFVLSTQQSFLSGNYNWAPGYFWDNHWGWNQNLYLPQTNPYIGSSFNSPFSVFFNGGFNSFPFK